MQKNLTPISTPDFNTVYENMGEVLRSVPMAQRQKYVDAYLLTGDGAQKLVAAMYKDNPALMHPQQPIQAPQGTVVGNMVQQAAAPMPEEAGLAQLPAGNISEDSFATGGIVAFDDGGEVPGYAGPQGSLVANPYSGNSITDPNFDSIMQGYKAALPAVIAKAKRGEPLTETDKAVVAFMQRYDGLGALPEAKPMAQPAASTVSGKLSPDDISAAGVAAAQEYKAGLGSVAPDKAATAPKASPVQGGLGGLPPAPKIDMNTFTPTKIEAPKKADYVPEKPTMEGIESLRSDAYKKAGIDESVYDERLDDVKKSLQGIEGEKKNAVANAIVMAGLGIASGTSQFALTNVAQGALPAFKEYKSDIKDLRDREEKLQDKKMAVKDAQQAFRQKSTDANLQQLETRTKEYNDANREYTKLRTEVDNQNATRADNMKVKSVETALKLSEIDINRFDAQSKREYYNRPDLVSATLGFLNQDPKFKELSGAEKAAMFATVYSGAHSTGTSGAKDNTIKNTVSKQVEDFMGGTSAKAKKYRALLSAGKDKEALALWQEVYNSKLAVVKQEGPAAGGQDPVLQYDPTTGTLTK